MENLGSEAETTVAAPMARPSFRNSLRLRLCLDILTPFLKDKVSWVKNEQLFSRKEDECYL
jgi:hypothetical protein